MMRTSFQPLAHLVDAAAEKWLTLANASEREKLLAKREITQAFQIGDNPELTFHGLRYLLRIHHDTQKQSSQLPELQIEVHKIALNN